jgi:predicted HicB family RNase H-like nuclease
MGKKNHVVTSVRIDPDLWKKAKITAIKQGTTLSSLIDKAVRNEISKTTEREADEKDSSDSA